MKWQPAKFSLPLQLHAAHIWLIDLDQLTDQENFLNDTEKKRTQSMSIELHRQRFINARGILRNLLAHYLHDTPQTIELMTTARGKLYLKNNSNKLFFNLTHSRNMTIYAFNYQYEIGIDIEVKRPLKNITGVAERIFSAEELNYLYNKETTLAQEEKFFTLWTRKEALVKGTGEGLSAPVQSITTTLPDGTLKPDIKYAKPLNLKLYELPTIEHCSAAVAANKNISHYHYFTLDKN